MTLYLGIDIGGTKIAGGLVYGDGSVVRTERWSTPLTGGTAILDAAQDLARLLVQEAPESVAGIGLGAGGQIDAARGIVIAASDILPGWSGTAVKKTFESALAISTFMENDVNALALGESRFGAGRGYAAVVFLGLGTGVGGALLFEGRIYHGAHSGGGEFGHILLTMDENASRRSLEEYASGTGFVQNWREITGSDAPKTGEEIAAEAVRDPNSPAAQAVTRTGEYLGFGLVTLANALDPDLIVIGGGLAAMGDALLDPARRILRDYALPEPARCPIVPAALGQFASVIGAASLAMP